MRPESRPWRVLVTGVDGEVVGQKVRSLRSADVLVAGYVGDDEVAAHAMAEEMLGGVDETVVAEGGAGEEGAPGAPDA